MDVDTSIYTGVSICVSIRFLKWVSKESKGLSKELSRELSRDTPDDEPLEVD